MIWECIASRWIVLRRFILMCSETTSACLPAHATGSLDLCVDGVEAMIQQWRSRAAKI